MEEEAAAGHTPTHGDRLFHTRIAEACDNSVLLRLVTELFDERHNPLFEQLGSHFENAAQLGRGDRRTPRGGRRDRAPVAAGRARGDVAAPGQLARPLHGELAGRAPTQRARQAPWRRPARRKPPCLPAGADAPRGTHDARLPHPRRARPARSRTIDAPRSARTTSRCAWAPAASAAPTCTTGSDGRVGAFVVREPLVPGHEASGTVLRTGARGHAREAGRQGRGQPVARLRPLRLLPRRAAEPVPAHVLPRQRERVPACAGHVPRALRDRRGAAHAGARGHLARPSSPAPSRCRSACTRCTAPGELLGRTRARHRRRHDRLHVRHRGAAGRRGAR